MEECARGGKIKVHLTYIRQYFPKFSRMVTLLEYLQLSGEKLDNYESLKRA